MQKNAMFFDTHRTKICRDMYRPSSNLVRFVKSLVSVIVVGHSPISNNTSFNRKKPH